MELRQLRHFVAVAEELHFGRAARRLRMAQPPLSQSIMRLEEALGAKLFQRSSREVQLTAAGTALLAQAREIVQRADEAERAVKLSASAERTIVRVGFVPLSISPALLQAVLAAYRPLLLTVALWALTIVAIVYTAPGAPMPVGR